jgi:hypothetical protein
MEKNLGLKSQYDHRIGMVLLRFKQLEFLASHSFQK